MSSHTVPGGLRDPAAGARCCPGWCVTAHGVHAGEEDWVHLSAPVAMVEGLLARVCMSIDPDSRAPDGPYVLIGSTELTPEETRALGETLVRLAGLEGSATEGVAAPADGVLARSGPAHDADSSIAGGSGKPGGRRPALLPP